MRLRYGINPHQTPATLSPIDPGTTPLRVLNGTPSYLNILDAVTAWRLVREAAELLGRPAAASFKHVSPAGAALAGPLDATATSLFALDPAATTPVASAYARARDTDPKSSYGDFAAVSHPVDAALAGLLRRVVSDGVIAPGYDPGALATLAAKKSGAYVILEADPDFRPPPAETRELFGLRLTQPADTALPHIDDPRLPPQAREDLLLGCVVARYTQSNSVVFLRDGATLGVGAGQQSRIDCTRLAAAKSATWWLRRHPAVEHAAEPSSGRVQDRVEAQLAAVDTVPGPDAWLTRLTGIAMVSDGALPFTDNVTEAHRHGVRYLAEPGNAIRSPGIRTACDRLGITLIQTGQRLFRH